MCCCCCGNCVVESCWMNWKAVLASPCHLEPFQNYCRNRGTDMSRIVPSEKHRVGVGVVEGQLDRRGGRQGGQLLCLLTRRTLPVGGEPSCLKGVEEARPEFIYFDRHPGCFCDCGVHNNGTQLKSSASKSVRCSVKVRK